MDLLPLGRVALVPASRTASVEPYGFQKGADGFQDVASKGVGRN